MLCGGLQHPLADAGHRPPGRQAALFGFVRSGPVCANQRRARTQHRDAHAQVNAGGLRPPHRPQRATATPGRSSQLGAKLKFAGPTTSAASRLVVTSRKLDSAKADLSESGGVERPDGSSVAQRRYFSRRACIDAWSPPAKRNRGRSSHECLLGRPWRPRNGVRLHCVA